METETITTKIWAEDAHPNNPFAADLCRCSGFDIYGDLLQHASYSEYLYLLFKLEPPSASQAQILERLAIAISNPGPRDHSVRAAMNAGVGGSTCASALIAALSVGAGNLGGAREVFCAVEYWQNYGTDLDLWKQAISNPPQESHMNIWLPMEHTPGFDPNGHSCPKPVIQTLDCLVAVGGTPCLHWLATHRVELEQVANCPLAFSGVAAAALHDLGLSAQQAEMLYLLLRLPGAAVHALEQEKMGWKKYPFFSKGFQIQGQSHIDTKVADTKIMDTKSADTTTLHKEADNG